MPPLADLFEMSVVNDDNIVTPALLPPRTPSPSQTMTASSSPASDHIMTPSRPMFHRLQTDQNTLKSCHYSHDPGAQQETLESFSHLPVYAAIDSPSARNVIPVSHKYGMLELDRFRGLAVCTAANSPSARNLIRVDDGGKDSDEEMIEKHSITQHPLTVEYRFEEEDSDESVSSQKSSEASTITVILGEQTMSASFTSAADDDTGANQQ